MHDSIIIVKVSTDGGYNWEDVTYNVPGEERWITRVVTDPVDENTMYIVRTGFSPGNKVWKTNDLGQTWLNISGDLPNLPSNDLFIDPDNTDHLFIANDLGVYLSTNGGENWVYSSAEMPFVPVMDFDYVKINDSSKYLRAGTHGRSIYETNLDDLTTYTEEHFDSNYAGIKNNFNVYPNPISSFCNIVFDQQHSGYAEIKLLNYFGQLILNIHQGSLPSGKHKYSWNASTLPNGIYFLQLRAGNEMVTRKIVKMR